MAFSAVTNLHYQNVKGNEYIWNTDTLTIAGALLGPTITRIRCVRTPAYDETRYRLVDEQEGTLPYHSWVVSHGDEQWPPVQTEAQPETLLEPYTHGFSFSETALRLTLPLADGERIYGFGERTGEMNKRGHAFPVWNVDPPIRHSVSTETMYTSVPFYIGMHVNSGRAYGVLIDHVGRVDIDMGKTNTTEATITVEGNSLVAYFFSGPTPKDVLQQYTELTGHMPLPARWTLGYHQCRWSYATAQQVRDVARQLRERHHPCDAIWLDIDYMQGYRNFTWNPDTFPDPATLLQELHDQHLHLITIVDPGTKVDEHYSVYQQGMHNDYFCRYENGDIFQGSVWPGVCVFPDFSRTEVRAWWGNLYKGFLEQGVDGFWNDMDEPALTNFFNREEDIDTLQGKTMDERVLHRAGGEQPTSQDGPPVLHKYFHNAYGMEMARATYEGLAHLKPDTRPFVLTRSGTAGMQRYAALWTGDNTSEWEHILLALRMCLNVGMSGIPFVGADIGGFWDIGNGELLIRFAQMGALMPFCRNHNALGNPDQEPWAFGEPYENAYRTAIETRYRLLPYLYTLFQQASTNGTPIMRPLYYHYPQDERAYETETQFLIGDALLSAPILDQGATSRTVYLPEGLWFDYWNGSEYPGAAFSDIPAPLEQWPLFVRGNSILPTIPVMQYVDEQPDAPLTFTCYMATDGLASYTLYEDDGSTQAYRNGAFATTAISCRVDGDFITVRIDEQHTGYQPKRAEYEIIMRVGNRVLQQRVKTGQGLSLIHI